VTLPQQTRRTVVLAAAAAAITACQPAPFKSIDLTGAAYAQDFRLPDADGFTQCPDVCPTALGRAIDVRKLLGADGDKVQVVFITVDPERDTPEVLREYMKAYDPSFIALRGNAEQLASTAKEFKVYFQKVPTKGSYTMDHTAVTYAFDPQGRVRLVLKHDQSAQEIASDLRNLLRG
jgi:protein SCO1/2